MDKWFEIFRTGAWNGGRWDPQAEAYVPYTERDLDTMVENFGRGERDVPLVIGHNGWWSSEEKPALGWVQALRREGDRLLALARDVKDELKAAVNEKLYPKRSVEIYDNLDGRGLTLSAVAFLGGSQPAVPGMPDFEFAGGGASGRTVLTFTVSAFAAASADEGGEGSSFAWASADRRPCHMEGTSLSITNTGKGGEEMDRKEIEALVAQGAAAAVEQFRQSDEFQSLAAKAAEADELKKRVTEQERAAIAEKCRAFAAGLLQAKKITPAVTNGDGSKRPGLATFLESLSDEQRGVAMAIFEAASWRGRPGRTRIRRTRLAR